MNEEPPSGHGPAGTPAAPGPADTATIETLAPDEARRLVAGWRDTGLYLDRLRALDAATAAVLAEMKVEYLSLNGLPALDPAAARALVKSPATHLYLGGLTVLDAATAGALAEFRGEEVYLLGLSSLDAATATALAAFAGGSLVINVFRGLPALAPGVAEALAESRVRFLAIGVTALDVAGARALARFAGEGLSVDRLPTLDRALAGAFAGFGGQWLALDSVVGLDPTTAAALAAFRGAEMCLNGLKTLDAATAAALAGFGGRQLSLGGLTALDMEVATALAHIAGSLYVTEELQWEFCTAHPLTVETAAAWVVVTGGDLAGVTALDGPDSVAIARILATRQGRLSLTDLERISPRALAALLEKPDVELPAREALEVIPDPGEGATGG